MTRPAKSYTAIYAVVVVVQASLNLSIGTRRGNINNKGEIPSDKNKYKASVTYQAHKNFFLHIVTSILQTFTRNLPKWSKLSYLKAKVLQVPQKV